MNVIRLDHYRSSRISFPVVGLITQPNRLVSLELPWNLIPIDQDDALATPINFCLIDTTVQWIDPFEITRQLSPRLPIIWLSPRSPSPTQGRRQMQWIRRAYSAGVSDIFYGPFDNAEIIQAMDVLLRLKRFG